MNLVGAVPDTPGAYGDVNRHSDYQQAPRPPRAAARSPLFYVNASLVRDRIKTLVGAADPTPRAVILDMSANGDRLDITGADTLTELIGELHGAGIDVALVEIRLPVREMARRSGLLDALGSNHVFHTIPEAVQAGRLHRCGVPGDSCCYGFHRDTAGLAVVLVGRR